VCQPNASIRHHDYQVPQTQFETRVPADTEDDDLPVEMSSLEQCFNRSEPLHSAIIPDHGLFAPEPRMRLRYKSLERRHFSSAKQHPRELMVPSL
jgi:hypothetical protein